MTIRLGNDPYSQYYVKKMNSFYPMLWEHLDILPSLPEEKGEVIVSYLLEIACQSTHISNIQLGRDSLSTIPQKWLTERIYDLAIRKLNLDDEWEFRRLLEVYKILDNNLLTNLCQLGKESKNSAIQEAANDFTEKLES